MLRVETSNKDDETSSLHTDESEKSECEWDQKGNPDFWPLVYHNESLLKNTPIYFMKCTNTFNV